MHWQAEIRGLHRFFEDWYRGTVENTVEVFSRVADALAPEFTLITSSGLAASREQVLSVLRSEHGARPDLKMEVADPKLRLSTEGIVLATYEEHGTTEGRTKRTLITAVLRENPRLRNGLEWVHIHEVALPSRS